MRTEFRLFALLAGLFLAFAVMYGVWTWVEDGRVEVAGTTALVLTCGLSVIIGSYFWFVSRRIDPRPEDRLDADIAEGAGELGFFSPGSYWPFGIALAASVAGLGLVFWMWWLIAIGLLMVIVAASAMIFEYYTGTRHTAEH